jgi:23S rRNA (cytosine1962-C5)-methyltransferase
LSSDEPFRFLKPVPISPLLPGIKEALSARTLLVEPSHTSAFRLINGFLEGCPGLVIDVYGTTLVVFNLADPPVLLDEIIPASIEYIQGTHPWLDSVLLKTRHSPSLKARLGTLFSGKSLSGKVSEGNVRYALNLLLNQDASLYLDTRNLRSWATANLEGRSVLNTFAYTGSLGVAALAGKASRVVQSDLNPKVLQLARESYALNGFPIAQADFITGNFFSTVSRLKHNGERFDCVFLDPPFFSNTRQGSLDLNTDTARLVNKLRPLVNDKGFLVSINNALYVSGKDYLVSLQGLCADGYLKIADLIPVPQDVIGFCPQPSPSPVADPAPFNHSTKIAVLEVRRKDTRTE